MSDDGTITRGELHASLTGRAIKPFRVGRRLELFMSNGRVVRGVVATAGRQAATLHVGEIPSWTDAHGVVQPGYPHVNIIPYRMVTKWRVPVADAPDGTWMPGHPDYRAQLTASNVNPVRDVKKGRR